MDKMELMNRKTMDIENILKTSISFLEKGYLSKRENYSLLDPCENVLNFEFSTGIRMIHLTKLIYEKDENILDKLSNIFTALYGNNTSLFLLLKSDGVICDFFLGVKDEKNITQALSTLKASLNGNFPGVVYKDNFSKEKIEETMEEILNGRVMEISTVTGIPSLKSENKEKFLQGVERVINGMEGKAFSGIFIANPIDYEAIKDIKKAYENLYNEIFPYMNLNISLNKNEAYSLSESVGKTFTKSYSLNLGKTDTVNRSISSGTSTSTSTGYSGSGGILGMALGGTIGLLSDGVGSAIGGAIGALVGGNIGTISKTNTSGKSSTETYGTSTSETSGETHGESKSEQNTTSKSKTESLGKTFQINEKNKTLENILKKIEQHLERIEKAEGNGLWNIGTYFISQEPQNSVVAANIYNGIIRGETSGVEKNGVYTFKDGEDLEKIKDYLYNFENPVLKLKDIDIFTSMGSLVTNDELALKLNLPQKSISGLDVLKMAAFGRNQEIEKKKEAIGIGELYYLGRTYEKEISLDLQTLSSHTFITGSTGAGKSNSVYCILEELYKKNIKFLVVEPAKGEYKNNFGGRENTYVYGTNKKYTELLKINPFSFNDNIHILEHIDRLTEIFNACWPMYAAMPAILKDAIENSYIMMGWDLKESENLYGERMFPTFKHLKKSLEDIINRSAYSQEAKGNYIGALVTRVDSLNNGIIGNIFVEDEISEKMLFDENVIIDISRIPSGETKSLVMGIVFMKLHEYRMAFGEGENSKLKHVTILEEAHNLLKRTSGEQSSEGSNLQGKSVEMMTNAIAEMRTYGEGFIIADQAPGMLDPAVIRNTNTKICLRLPSLEDREIVGKSMNLSQDQIEELAKLDTGVAAIIQSNWKEACLVKFNYMENKLPYSYSLKNFQEKEFKNSLIKYLLNEKLPSEERIKQDKEEEVKEYLENKGIKIQDKSPKEIDKYIFKLLDGDKILKIVNGITSENIEEWHNKLQVILNNMLFINESDNFYKLEIANSIIRENTCRNPEYLEFYEEWNDFTKKINIL
ncbi:helicase HerA domain-containing protein [Cetobacterium sp. SF1]|uniref:ATP-binding protein n=1 Tax=Cetobacterium sp. SF1 TaxID=3417654 RepID=UPI003CE7C431